MRGRQSRSQYLLKVLLLLLFGFPFLLGFFPFLILLFLLGLELLFGSFLLGCKRLRGARCRIPPETLAREQFVGVATH